MDDTAAARTEAPLRRLSRRAALLAGAVALALCVPVAGAAAAGSTGGAAAGPTGPVGTAGGAAAGATPTTDSSPAVRYAVGSAAMQTAQAIARRQWGVDACGGQVQLSWTVDSPRINAESYWSNPTSAYGAPALNNSCRIEFNSVVPFNWDMFCTVVVHEYGHLTGHQHAADGPDVMSPIYRAPLPACADTPDPSAPARSGGAAAASSNSRSRSRTVSLRGTGRGARAHPTRSQRAKPHRTNAHRTKAHRTKSHRTRSHATRDRTKSHRTRSHRRHR